MLTPAEFVELLLRKLERPPMSWPPASEVAPWEQVRKYRAFVERDRDVLKAAHPGVWPDDRPYRIHPIGGLIAEAWADALFSDEPQITPGNDQDAEQLAALLEANEGLLEDLHAAVRRMASEGEAWFRVVADAEANEHPTGEWFGRDSVIPLWMGKTLRAAAIVTELDPLNDVVPERAGQAGTDPTVYRHLEVHADGLVANVLYAGTASTLGRRAPLTEHPATEGLRDAWEHGLPMLVGRWKNNRGPHRLGRSDLWCVEDELLDLNEARTIGAENARLTAKKRVTVPERVLDTSVLDALVDDDSTVREAGARAARMDLGSDVLVQRNLDDRLGHDPADMFKVLEYSFDATPLVVHKRDLIETAVTAVGLTPQIVGVSTDDGTGALVSGTALRIRLIPHTRAVGGKARPVDRGAPEYLRLLQLVDALDVARGGFGTPWASADTPPAVVRGSAIPLDEVEESSIQTQLVAAGLRSKLAAIRALNPDWTEQQAQDELDRINQERPQTSGVFNPGLA